MSAFWKYVSEVQVAFPEFRVRQFNESWFFRLAMKLGWRMAAVTLGKTVWLGERYWDTDEGLDTLRHEVVHVTDQAKWGLLFWLSYFILPLGPSFKAFWEWRGYKESLRAEFDRNGKVDDYTREWVTNQFVYQNYQWMWPFPKTVRRWVDEHCASFDAKRAA